ncbi:MAG TPA: hypothetical protein VJL39_01885 [Candidatus Paceibacterota bacterium]
MDEELRQKLNAIETKVEAARIAAEKARRYLLVIVIVTLVAFILPLVGLIFAVPSLLSTYGEMYELIQ